MRGFRYTLMGFVGFLLVTGFNVSIGIVVYSLIQEKSNEYVSILIIGLIILSSLLCSVIDYVRRRLTIQEPLEEIMIATEMMSNGNFKIDLTPNHPYEYYDEFDNIKISLNKMAKELSKSEILKNDFIASVSHEIKTPLFVIQNYAKELQNKNCTEEQKEKYLLNLQDSCVRLSNLVMNILKLNKLENQELIQDIKKFNLSELLINQVLQYEELIEKKQIELNCDIEEDLIINSEKSYLEIIFNNLISNAIKFTETNGKIDISLKKDEEKYIIKVSDTGCGMDKETGMRIFEKFYQGDTSHSKEGNGLGLSLVKKVIDILGGKISVESELGKGTSFTVVIREV